MRYTDYKFRWVRGAYRPRDRQGLGEGGAEGRGTGPPRAGRAPAAQAPFRRLAKSTLTLIPLLGVHEVVFAFVTDEHAQGTLRSAKLFFDLFLSSFQVPALPCSRLAPSWPRCGPDCLLSPGLAGGCSVLFPQQGGRWGGLGPGLRLGSEGSIGALASPMQGGGALVSICVVTLATMPSAGPETASLSLALMLCSVKRGARNRKTPGSRGGAACLALHPGHPAVLQGWEVGGPGGGVGLA